ncbi:MAG: hypothetical protein H6684_08745 [Deltaproteobacteria bacterium]|nr:hypothetical protein [Deltaproteobacteria bacterium]
MTSARSGRESRSILRRTMWWPALVVALSLGAGLAACGGGGHHKNKTVDDEENLPLPDTLVEILEDRTGYDWSFNAGDIGAPDLRDWRFLFAVNLTGEQAEELIGGGEWAVDFDEIADELDEVGGDLISEGLDLRHVDNQVAMAYVDVIDGRERYRLAHKLTFDGGVMAVDTDAAATFGGGVGSRGPGWYAVFAARRPYAFVHGRALDCEGAARTNVTAEIDQGPFTNLTDADGRVVLASVIKTTANPDGRPATILLDGGACVGTLALPVTDGEAHPNPKCATLADGCEDAASTLAGDGTVLVGPFEADLSEIGFDPSGDADETCANCDFETGDTTGWNSMPIGDESGQACFGVESAGYDDLFPGGEGESYAYLTTGGDGRTGCAAWRRLRVPEDATTLVISYDLATQETPGGLGSPYTDVFAAVLRDSGDFVIGRTVNDEATGDDFVSIPNSAEAIAGVATSKDAVPNENGAVFDTHLFAPDGEDGPRGARADDHLGAQVRYAVNPGETLTLIFSVHDTGDAFFDTAALIDEVAFE